MSWGAAMADFNLSLRLSADGKNFVGAVKLSRQEIDKLGRGMITTKGRATGLDREMGKTSRTMRLMKTNVLGLRSAFAGLGLGLVVGDIVRAGTAMEGFVAGMTAATGSAEGAQNELRFVREEAERLGIEFEGAAGAFTQLAASARGTKLEGQGVRDIFTAVSEAGRVMNLTAEQSEGALRAIQQMMSKGTVQAEELRGQLGERLPGAFQIAARAMGVTTSELGDMLQKGEVLAEDLLPKLAKELRATFAEGLPDATDNATSAFNRLGNALGDLKRSIAESGLLDLIAGAARGTTTFARAVRHLGEQLGILQFNLKQAPLGEVMLELEDAERTLARFKEQLAAENAGPFGFVSEATRKGLNEAREEVEALRRQYEILNKEQMAFLDPPSAGGGDEGGGGDRAGGGKLDDAQKAARRQHKLTEATIARVVKARDDLIKQSGRVVDRVLDEEAAFAAFNKELALLDKRLELGRKGLVAFTDEDHARAVQGLVEEFSLMAEVIEEEVDPALDAWAKRFEELMEQQREGFRDVERAIKDLSTSIEDNLLDAFEDGEFSFKRFLGSMLRDLREFQRESSSGGGLLGGLLGGGGGGGGFFSELLGDLLPGSKFGQVGTGIFAGTPTSPSTFSGVPDFSGLFHRGGIAGQATQHKAVGPAVFLGAPRYHNGGLAGDEVPAILKRGEEVLPASDPRHRNNAGNSSAKPILINIDARGAEAGAAERLMAVADQIGRNVKAEILDSARRGGAFASMQRR